MADPKNLSVNGKHAAVNGHHVVDKTDKQSKLRQLLTLAKEVAKDAEAIGDYETSAKERAGLQEELDIRRTEANNLRELNSKLLHDFSEYKTQAGAKSETLFAEFEKKFRKYEANNEAVESMRTQVVELEANLLAAQLYEKTARDEAGKLTEKAIAADKYAKSQADEIKEMNAECEIHRSRMQTGIVELEGCKERLAAAERDIGGGTLHSYGSDGLRKLGLELRGLSRKCHELAMEYFNERDGAKDSASEMVDLKARFPKVPLSTSTSTCAAMMRCAVAEAIISEALTTQIFTPFYLSNGARTAASDLLDIFGDDDKSRSIYRCQILRSMRDQDERQRIEDDIIRKASNEVRTTLHPLVIVPKQSAFYNTVPQIFREALKLWSEVQRSRELITADAPDVTEVQPPSKLDDFDSVAEMPKRVKNGTSDERRSIAAVLFPQVATKEDLIFNGVVLWSDQPVLLAAAQEFGPPAKSLSAAAGRQAGRRRRSIVAPESPLKGRVLANGT